MSAGFTPGPWRVMPDIKGRMTLIYGGDHALAECFSNGSDTNLIAAAPKLYALALCALDYFDSPDHSQGQVNTIVDALRTVLAEARGEQP